MELYVHIPFCVKKCYYCDFLSMPADDTVKAQYVQALKNEIIYSGKTLPLQTGTNQTEKMIVLETIYFGGGTPSVLPIESLIDLLKTIQSAFLVEKQAEITIEINPATISYRGLHKLREAGFNRLSIGLQSTDNHQLKQLGRIHTYEDFLETYQNARKAGFENINVDCISALPGQTLKEYTEGLHKILELKPEHVSSYSLIIEEGTLFYDLYENKKDLLPDEDTDRAMYRETNKILQAYNYERYEISNYGKKGYFSKHNIGYWKRVPYIGLGLGAASFFQNRRMKNQTDLKAYIQLWNGSKVIDLPEKLALGLHNTELLKQDLTFKKRYVENDFVNTADAMAEYFFLGLRMTEGVSISDFQKEFGIDVFEKYGIVLNELEKEKLIKIKGHENRICLTEYGMDICNWVFEKFI